MVNVKEKAGKTSQVTCEETNESEPSMSCRNYRTEDVETSLQPCGSEQRWGNLNPASVASGR